MPAPVPANTLVKPQSKVSNVFNRASSNNAALLSTPDGDLTEIKQDEWGSFDTKGVIIEDTTTGERYTYATFMKSQWNTLNGKKSYVRTSTYNSWKAQELARKEKGLNDVMARFKEHLADTNPYKDFSDRDFEALVTGGRINKNDYLKSTSETRDPYNRLFIFTSYTKTIEGGSRKRYRKTRRRSTKHRKTKCR